jgi:hypothetical protein
VLWAGTAAKIFLLASCSLQLAKAGSAETRPQKRKNRTADVQQGRVKIAIFM